VKFDFLSTAILCKPLFFFFFYRHCSLSSTGHFFDKLNWCNKLYSSYNKLCMFSKPSLNLVLKTISLTATSIQIHTTYKSLSLDHDKPSYLIKHPGFSLGLISSSYICVSSVYEAVPLVIAFVLLAVLPDANYESLIVLSVYNFSSTPRFF